jgi:sec-independent protein translocase protein TatC
VSETLTFHEHIAELRRRVLWVVMAILISATIGYNLREPIIRILQNPLGQPLFYSSPAGSFNFVMQIAAVIGIFVALPVMVYQLLRFIEPALPKRIKRKSMLSIISLSVLLAAAGATFAFVYIVPTSLKFFAGYSNEQIQPLISANEYLRFVINSMVTFAVIFQIPLIFYFIDRIKPIPPKNILHYQRHTIVAAFLIAVLLPFTYDPITQFIIAVPIIVLFYLSVTVLWITNRRRNKRLSKVAPLPVMHTANVTPAPVPVLTLVPQAQNNVPARALRPTTIDGFVLRQPVHEQRTPVLASQPISRPTTYLNQTPRRARRRLSIDGIRPLGAT